MITLKTLPQATAQEVFDQVVTHLLTQMKQSKSSPNGICAYRGKNGLKCAAGCLIADDEYTPEMDNPNPLPNVKVDSNWASQVANGLFPHDHCDLVMKLQRLHDNNYVCDWEERLKLLAKKEGLKFNWKGLGV